MPDPISRQIANGAGRHGPLVLVYHGIVAHGENSNWPYAIAIARFRDHLDYLADEGWQTVPMSALLATAPHPPRTLVISFDDGYADNAQAVDALSARGMHATWFIVANHVDGCADWPGSDRPRTPMLSRTALTDMAAAGFEIGSHTLTHPRLAGLPADHLAAETSGARARLQDMLGLEIAGFAYPYGVADAAAEAAVTAAGHTFACTTATGWALGDRHPLRIRRLTVLGHDGVSRLARKLAFADIDVGWPAVARYAARRLGARLAVA